VLLEFLAHVFVSRVVMTTGFALSIAFVQLGRNVTRGVLRWFYADPKITIPLVILGFNPFAKSLCDQIVEDLSQYEMLGFLDDQAERSSTYHGYSVIGTLQQLGHLAASHPGLELIIATPEASVERQEEVIRQCETYRVRWRIVPTLLRSLSTAFRLDLIGGVPLIGPVSCNIEGLNFVMKRAFDLIVALLVLVLALPLMILVSIAIWITDGRPIFFRQKRIGIRGETFELLKFRTMHTGAPDHAHRQYVAKWIAQNGEATQQVDGQRVYKLVDDPRVITIGRLLRSTAIDELPQLINVLRGEMSLVGPRPALPYELELYQDWHRRRLDALPGITGLWQVGDRNRMGFDDMVRLDLEYLNGWSLGSDLRILLRTVPSVLGGEGF
jgi:exopolysaccharide biosynthesis polyprenyl glycosylphosphotransferase